MADVQRWITVGGKRVPIKGREGGRGTSDFKAKAASLLSEAGLEDAAQARKDGVAVHFASGASLIIAESGGNAKVSFLPSGRGRTIGTKQGTEEVGNFKIDDPDLLAAIKTFAKTENGKG
jgi:hypothetical protein